MRLVGVILLVAGLTCAASCPAPKQLRHRLLRARSSVRAGARLLNGLHSRDAEDCRRACCRHHLCDTAVHSTKLDRCYLVHCGKPNRCTYSSAKHYNVYIFNRTDENFKRRTKVPTNETEEEETEEAERDKNVGFITTKPISSNKVEQNAHLTSSSSAILTSWSPPKKNAIRLTTRNPISPNKVEQSAQRTSSSPAILTTRSPRSDKEMKSDVNTTNSWEAKEHQLLLQVLKIQKKNNELKHKVQNLDVAIDFISIFLILSFLFIILILVRAKRMITKMSPKSLVLPSRGDETDDLINGIYS